MRIRHMKQALSFPNIVGNMILPYSQVQSLTRKPEMRHDDILMAYHADPSSPDTIEDWLDGFDIFSIYEVLPEILAMWGDNFHTESESKKTVEKQPGTEYSPVSAAVP